MGVAYFKVKLSNLCTNLQRAIFIELLKFSEAGEGGGGRERCQRISFLSRFGLKWGIDFGLKVSKRVLGSSNKGLKRGTGVYTLLSEIRSRFGESSRIPREGIVLLEIFGEAI